MRRNTWRNKFLANLGEEAQTDLGAPNRRLNFLAQQFRCLNLWASSIVTTLWTDLISIISLMVLVHGTVDCIIPKHNFGQRSTAAIASH